MPKETIFLELEPEDVKLLTDTARETGKSVSQLTQEAIRLTYDCSTDSKIHTAVALFESVTHISSQVKKVLAALDRQHMLIEQPLGKHGELPKQPPPA